MRSGWMRKRRWRRLRNGTPVSQPSGCDTWVMSAFDPKQTFTTDKRRPDASCYRLKMTRSGSFSERHGFHGPEAEITIREDAPEEVREAVLMLGYATGMGPNAMREAVCGVLLRRPDPGNWSPSNVESEVGRLVDEGHAHPPVVVAGRGDGGGGFSLCRPRAHRSQRAPTRPRCGPVKMRGRRSPPQAVARRPAGARTAREGTTARGAMACRLAQAIHLEQREELVVTCGLRTHHLVVRWP